MITTLLKHVQDLLYEYKVKGPAILTNCESVPAFRHLVQHLSKITLEHVGINRDNLKDYFRKDTTTYFNILEEQEFCVGVFCLSKGSSLKLHDHPGMLVVSKFLTGTIHHRSLDLVDKSYQVELPQLLMDDDETVDVIGKKLEAVVRGEKTLEAGEINYLTPDRANIHKYTAMEDTAILDILLPNYNETDHYCNYYLEMPIEENDGETSTWTTETELDKAHDKGRQHFMECENDMNKKREFVFEGLFPEFKGHKLREAGERTTLIYSFPPLDEPISLVPYNGERFEYPGVKWE